MENIGGFGLKVVLVASSTFPAGINITQFADDADPLDSPAVDLSEPAMGLNGDLVAWGKAVPIPLTINVIPGSDDDKNLEILARINKVGAGKNAVADTINVTAVYPDGSKATFISGTITNAPLASSVASSGRLKSKAYSFAFENAY